MKFQGFELINWKENIHLGYRNGSRIVNRQCVNKTSRNYGADTNLSFVITYEIPRLSLSQFNRKYPRRLQKSKSVNNNYLR